jgi:hypothetical protein
MAATIEGIRDTSTTITPTMISARAS